MIFKKCISAHIKKAEGRFEHVHDMRLTSPRLIPLIYDIIQPNRSIRTIKQNF